MDPLTSAWFTKLAFQRGVALVYLIAFLAAFHQFVPLLGERGLLPVPLFARRVSFRDTPSLFLFAPKDRFFRSAALLGALLSGAALLGLTERYTWLSVAVWVSLWILYLSFVNVGQTFYAFGWESILLETGFFTIFSGSLNAAPPRALIWIWRWILFRVMFGAGLIKLRADRCWRDLSCLDYHFETQPMPNGLSWRFHWLPRWAHQAGVAFNHFVELIVPFAYFAPQPICAIAGLLTILFQLILMLSGNLAWLNLVTIVLALGTFDGRMLQHVIPIQPPMIHPPSTPHQVAVAVLVVIVALLSVDPVLNLFSRRQLMNYSYNPIHLVNTYGAFGGVSRIRPEVIVEGASDAVTTPATQWREYEFKGKPGDPLRRPPQIAPYHLRLDWLMWFAALRPDQVPTWFIQFAAKLLEGDPQTMKLLKNNPFPEQPPRQVRALLYEYRFTTSAERRATGRWWNRSLVGVYLPPMALAGAQDPCWSSQSPNDLKQITIPSGNRAK
jgi:hypothetical protein